MKSDARVRKEIERFEKKIIEHRGTPFAEAYHQRVCALLWVLSDVEQDVG